MQIIFLIHHHTKDHRHPGTRRRGQNGRAGDGGGVHASVLAPVGDHCDGNQLKGGNIHNQEGTHFPAGGSGRRRFAARNFPSSPLFFEHFQILHGFQARRGGCHAKTKEIRNEIHGN